MGFLKKLKKAARGLGKLAKAGAGIALAGVPGASVAEKVLRLKQMAGDRKRELLMAKSARKSAAQDAQVKLTKLGTTMRKGPILPKSVTQPQKPGVLSLAKTPGLTTGVRDLLKDNKLQSSAATKARASLTLSDSRALEAKTKRLTKSDWEALAAQYKASGSKLKWEDWVKEAI